MNECNLKTYWNENLFALKTLLRKGGTFLFIYFYKNEKKKCKIHVYSKVYTTSLRGIFFTIKNDANGFKSTLLKAIFILDSLKLNN